MYHENYIYYKEARDKAWETLIKCKITSLPVNLAVVAKLNNITILKYSDSKKELSGDGFSLNVNGINVIYYNDKKPANRIRFTLAHELGHCLLGHLRFGKTYNRNSELDFDGMDIYEMQANVFARDLLMPATVLHSLDIKSYKDISQLCNVSLQSAKIRYTRLLKLKKRGMFNKHPFERQVYHQFKEYIKRH
ncbi:MAG: ImmA/IrrE family metallo-endopeptidase [Clostridia bacterium]|nr:ImmA/IrrE family metallo-endopeptidase [Clostridia bacterium]